MDEKWRVSRVEPLEGGLHYGFVLYGRKGHCAAFEAWFLDPTCRQTHVKKVARTKHQLAHN